VEDIWELITRDLRYAVGNLPATAAQDGRLTSWSAKGMLAKMFLFRAGVSGTRNQAYLDSAKLYAGDVCNNSPYVLEAKYADLFKSENHNSSKNNKESLFSIQWMPSKDPWGINNSFQAYMARDGEMTGSWDGWGAAHGASANLVRYYLDNPADSFRRKATFMFDNDVYPEIRKDRNGYLFPASWNAGTNQWVKQTAGIANSKKYIIGSVSDNGGKGSEMAAFINTYMLRLAEVYLIYAEALMGTSTSTTNAEAIKFYNLVRTRAGMPTKTSVTWDDIFLEKRIETVYEGVFWYELVRLYYFDPAKAKSIINAQDKGDYTLQYINGTFNPRQYTIVYNPVTYPVTDATMFFPMPEAELIKAPGLAEAPVAFDFSLIPE
jgi:starch-binding outer membrane protein, SusD/RagB family